MFTPLRILLDVFVWLFLPHCCIVCDWPGTLLCQNCSHSLDFCTQQESSVYYPDIPLLSVCRFDATSQKIIHTYKYQGIPDFGERIAELLYAHIPLPPIDFITSVPPDPARKKQRGFDHTQKIAQHLAKKLGVPYVALLKKNTTSGSQARTITKEVRLKNASNRFSLAENIAEAHRYKNKSVLLIDDVCTTGSTLRECMKHLALLHIQPKCAVFCVRI